MTTREGRAPAETWYEVDADGQVLGRLATRVATVLRGKHRPDFAPHIDPGDHVIVTNAARVRLTGRKLEQKVHYHHTGYPGGLKQTPYTRLMKEHPERIVEYAVSGMLPKTKLGRTLRRHLRVYAGPEHPHAAQQPRPLPDAGRAAPREEENTNG
jgi:large subunit ribosomal protein L13